MKNATITKQWKNDKVIYDFSDNDVFLIVVPTSLEWLAEDRIKNFFSGASNDLIFRDIATFVKK